MLMRPALRLVVGLAAATLVVAGPAVTAAGANPPGPHDPTGAITARKAVPGGVQFTGWAGDPDAPTTPLTVTVLQDGRASVARAVTAQPVAGRAAFAVSAPVAAGAHTLCVVAGNVGAGLDTVLGCVPTPLGTTLTAGQLAQHDPLGVVDATTASATTLRVTGWATDPDDVARPDVVVLYVDGSPARTVNTGPHTGAPAGYGPRARFDISVPVPAGAHVGCVWAVSVGLGSNTFVGCQAVDTRGPAATTPVTTPPVNVKVLAEAKKHIGQRYVWGAAGPSTFDCSGLVKYSYGIAGMSTLPRVSEAQFAAARLIPASRVQPGDLVFTHDSEGDVYHVGIYVSPGKALAAIDESQGVNYQSIWDPAATTYGSYTHT